MSEREQDFTGRAPHNRPESDLAWLDRFKEELWTTARTGFEQSGRGACLVGKLALITSEGPKIAYHYVPQSDLMDKDGWDPLLIPNDSEYEELLRMVESYDPEEEFVVSLEKLDDDSRPYQLTRPRAESQ